MKCFDLDSENTFCYLSDMEKPTKTIKADDADRLDRIAFWLWEYTRRNHHYRRYVDVVYQYYNRFDEVGELENVLNYLGYDNIHTISSDPDFDLADNSLTRELSKKHGEVYAKYFYKMCFLFYKFNFRFGRPLKDYNDGLDSEKALKDLLDGKEVLFRSKDQYDHYAVIHLRNEWMMTVDGDVPNFNMAVVEDDSEIRVDPAKVLTHSSELAKEANTLKIYNNMYRDFSKGGYIDYDTKIQVYQLGAAGKDIKPTGDLKRFVMLWLWDQAHKPEEKGDPPKTFDEAFPLLKENLHEGYLSTLCHEVTSRKSRSRGYYQTTEKCIEELTIFPFKS